MGRIELGQDKLFVHWLGFIQMLNELFGRDVTGNEIAGRLELGR